MNPIVGLSNWNQLAKFLFKYKYKSSFVCASGRNEMVILWFWRPNRTLKKCIIYTSTIRKYIIFYFNLGLYENIWKHFLTFHTAWNVYTSIQKNYKCIFCKVLMTNNVIPILTNINISDSTTYFLFNFCVNFLFIFVSLTKKNIFKYWTSKLYYL